MHPSLEQPTVRNKCFGSNAFLERDNNSVCGEAMELCNEIMKSFEVSRSLSTYRNILKHLRAAAVSARKYLQFRRIFLFRLEPNYYVY